MRYFFRRLRFAVLNFLLRFFTRLCNWVLNRCLKAVR